MKFCSFDHQEEGGRNQNIYLTLSTSHCFIHDPYLVIMVYFCVYFNSYQSFKLPMPQIIDFFVNGLYCFLSMARDIKKTIIKITTLAYKIFF